MKIAFFGYDFFVDVLEHLVDAGHDLIEVFVGDADNFYNYNERTIAVASRIGCPARFGRPDPDAVALLRERCDVALVMAYQHKVPVVDGLRAVNLHPTLLPEGRGVWPLPWLLLRYPEYAGLTLHKLTEKMDAGPIIAQQRIAVAADENLESLTAKLQMAAPRFVADIMENLEHAWHDARPQEGGSTWPMPSDAVRELDWGSGVEGVLRVVRAFGKFESTAIVGEREWMVTDATGWMEPHSHAVGTVVHRLGREVVVAVSDGYVLLRHFHREFDFSKP